MLDRLNVLIIMGNNWTKEKVLEDLKGEGYQHNFYFVDNYGLGKFKTQGKIANECWCFGNCYNHPIYLYSEKNSIDIWQMG